MLTLKMTVQNQDIFRTREPGIQYKLLLLLIFSVAVSVSWFAFQGLSDAACPNDVPKCGFSPSIKVTSDTTQASAAPGDLVIRVKKPLDNFNLTGFDLSMPHGLPGNITATPRCSHSQAQAAADVHAKEACNADTKVGYIETKVRISLNEVITIKGSLYNGAPVGNEPGRLITYIPDLGEIADNESVLISSPMTIRGQGDGIDTKVEIPTELWDFNLFQMDIHINGKTNTTGTGPFMINPTHCSPGSFNAKFYGTYGGPFGSATDKQGSGSATYTATGCGGVPFNPRITVFPSTMKLGAATTMTTEISQSFGEAAMRDMSISFKMPLNLKAIPDPCTAAEVAAGGAKCKIADLTADSWLLPAPLTGAIYFGEAGKTYMSLSGLINVSLTGSINIDAAKGSSGISVSGMPPMPVTKITASGISLFKNPSKCTQGEVSLSASSHAGHTSSSAQGLNFCPYGEPGKTPKLKVRLSPNRRRAYTNLKAEFKPVEPVKLKSLTLSMGKKKEAVKASLKRLKRGRAKTKRGVKLGKLIVYGRKSKKTVRTELRAKRGKLVVVTDRKSLKKLKRSVRKAKKSKSKKRYRRSRKALSSYRKTVKKIKLRVKRSKIYLKGIPKKVKVKRVLISLKGKRVKLLRNPKKAKSVTFTAKVKTSSNQSVTAQKTVKLKKAKKKKKRRKKKARSSSFDHAPSVPIQSGP